MPHPDPVSRVTLALQRFHERARAAFGSPGFPPAQVDPDWLSDCQFDPADPGAWRPVPQRPAVDFSGIERALEVALHPDVKAWYGSFWSACLAARAKEGELSLIQLWNPLDFERLRANLLGHALARRRGRAPLTVFFANTEPDSELFLSVVNASGEVVLEHPADGMARRVESDLATFVDRLEPCAVAPALY
jgi:SecY interacting protein Syd